jgi:hypothetical protein
MLMTALTLPNDGPPKASLEHFEKRYRKLWDQDKDAYIRRWASVRTPARARAHVR